MSSETSQQIASYNWSFARSFDGSFSFDAIRTSAALETMRETKALHATMKRIEQHLLGLGSDGLHTVLRHQRDIAWAAQKKARKAARLKRARAKARRLLKAKP